ncbi:reverse transcriptase domain-containing protein [Tanacetum coccineum]
MKEICSIVEEEGDNWMTPIIQCLEKGIWPEDKNKARNLRVKINQYAMESGVLFKKSYLVPMLRCVGQLQENYIIWEIHMGSCGMHFGPRAVVKKAMRQGYYWPTMREDAKKEIQKEKAGWVDELPNVLWAHQKTIKTSNGETPFSLTYGSEAVILEKIGMPTYRTIMIKEGFNEEEIRHNLDLLTERRELAAIREARYKMKLEQNYKKKVQLTSFKPKEFVF